MYDLAILYNKSSLKRLFSVGFFITAVPYVILFTTHASPHGLIIILIIVMLIVLFTFLLLYSVFLETSLFSKTAGVLFTEGTYSFSRHPGFLWYTIVGLLISFYFWDLQIMLLFLGLIVCNLILIIVEDTFIFPRMFLEYHTYKKHTPFFISCKKLNFWRRSQ